MTNKGAIWNILGSDAVSGDLPSRSVLGWLSQSASYCTFTQYQDLPGYYPTAPMIMLIDNPDDNEIEFAVVSGSSTKYLKVYSVTLGAVPEITLKSNTLVTYTSSGDYFFNYFGIVKVSEELYYVYYAIERYTGAPDYDNFLEFKRLEVEPGVGYTDALLQQYDVGTGVFADYPDYGDFEYMRSIVCDNKGYVGTYRRLRDEWSDIYDNQVYLWNVDLETGTVSGGYQGWSIPINAGIVGSSLPPFVLSKYQDTISITSCWCTISSSTFPGTFNGYVIKDGVSTLVHTIADIITRSMWDSHNGKVVHYGTSNYLIEITWHLSPYVAPRNIYLGAYISNDGIVTKRTDDPGSYYLLECYNAQGMSYPGFTDIGNTLKLKKDPDDDNYYWVDEYGANTTELSIAGVTPSFVYQVFPARNSATDGIYANVLLTDAIDDEWQFLVELAPDLSSIVAYYPHGNLNYHSCFNHGRFFITWYSTTVYVQYLVDLTPPLNKNVLILEYG